MRMPSVQFFTYFYIDIELYFAVDCFELCFLSEGKEEFILYKETTKKIGFTISIFIFFYNDFKFNRTIVFRTLKYLDWKILYLSINEANG